MRLEEIRTPALVVDIEAMERNLRKMASYFAGRPCGLRPHFKNHKSPALARKQIQAGAIGITCATVREAQILVEDGLGPILIANEVAGIEKPNEIADLSRRAAVIACIDNDVAVRDLAVAQRNQNAQIGVLVDIDIGLNRCGTSPGQAALDLARYASTQGLLVRGVMGYDGHLQAIPASPERDHIVRQGSKAIVDSAELISGSGMDGSVRSTGGTGTYSVSGEYPGITEIQAGSYLLMDDVYVGRGAPFERSLTVLATVVSTRAENHAVLDCGVKAISGERGLPILKNAPGTHLVALHAEHAILTLESGARALTPGQKVEVSVNYSDATVNLHSKLFGVHNGEIEEIFTIEH